MGKNKALFQNIAVLAAGCLAALLLLELFFRVYNPFQFRVQGENIILPAGKKYVLKDHGFSRLDTVITHTKNSLGFRGPERPPDAVMSLVTVGGSTTECFYLSDGKTWTDRLAVLLERDFPRLWVNNAGLDGHSTRGHILLVRDHLARLRPSAIVFLVGLNDMGFKAGGGGAVSGWLAKHIRIAGIIQNIFRYADAKKRGLVHTPVDVAALKEREIPEKAESAIINAHKINFLPGYERRLNMLADECISNGITPVFVTQPAMYGFGKDPSSGADLGRISVLNRNGRVSWETLELYNDVTRKMCRERNITCIDLAARMPKDSRYYYDFYHFTNAGAEKVAEIIYPDVKQVLAGRAGSAVSTK